MKAIPKPQKVTQDETRLDFVRKMPCLLQYHPYHAGECSTGYEGARFRSEAHHVRKGTQTGLGRKPPANRTVPLCTVAHREYHNLGHDTFVAKYILPIEGHLLRINREFEQSHPRRRPKCERKIETPAIKHLRVKCPCGLTHDLPPTKIVRYGSGLRYQCFKSGEWYALRIAG